MKSLTQWLNEKQDLALLLVRIGVGLMFIFVHGGPKVFGGVAAWTKLGSMIGVLGITFAPAALGFIAGAFELLGGIMILLGLGTRLGGAMIFSTLLIASPTMYIVTKGFFGAAAAIEGSLYSLLFIFFGAGKYSLDHMLFEKNLYRRGY